MTDQSEDLLYARTSALTKYGKLTDDPVRVALPFELQEWFTRFTHDEGSTPRAYLQELVAILFENKELQQLATESGMSSMEFLRDLIALRVSGFAMLTKIHQDRLRMVAGIRQE